MIKAIAYSGAGATGTVGGSYEVTLNFVAPPTVPPPVSPPVLINFQPSAATTVPSYLVDSGLTFADRGNGQNYGWSTSHIDSVFDRNMNANQLLDTHVAVKAGATWELDVPNGTYTVTISVGDAGGSSTSTINIEGTTFFSGVPLGPATFIARKTQVTVADGRLTLGIGAAATGDTKINFIEIV